MDEETGKKDMMEERKERRQGGRLLMNRVVLITNIVSLLR